MSERALTLGRLRAWRAPVLPPLPRPLRRHRTALIVGGSAVLHAGVFALAGLESGDRGAAQLVEPDRPVFIEIEPRYLRAGERPRPQTVTPDTAGPAAVRPRIRLLDPARPGQTLALPPATVAADAQAQGVDPLWQVRPESEDDRAARAIRAAGFGCHPANRVLTPAEQASCDERLAAAARGRPAIAGSGDAERDRALAREGAAAIARYEAQRAPLSAEPGITRPADCAGSNLGTGCAGRHLPPVPGVDMRQGADSLTRQPSNKIEED